MENETQSLVFVRRLLRQPWMAITMAVLFFLALTILSDRYLRSQRADFTEDQLYTLSAGTIEILSRIDEPVELTFYFSRSLAAPFPAMLNHGKRIEELLRTMETGAHGMLHVSIIDPAPFSEEEDAAVAAGITGVPLQTGNSLYLGVAGENATDGQQVLGYLAPEREAYLEYDLVKMVSGLVTSARRTVGVLTQLPLQFGRGGPQAAFQGQSQPYMIYEQLSEFFDVEMIQPDFDALPTTLDVLLLLHPPALEDTQLHHIDQYVLGGGRTIVFVDPHNESLNPGAYAADASGLSPLLESWGVRLETDQIIYDPASAQRVSFGGGQVADYPIWLNISGDSLDGTDIVSGSVNSLSFASAGSLSIAEGAASRFVPIVSSSDEAVLVPVDKIIGTPDVDGLKRGATGPTARHILVGRLTGEASSAFPALVSDGEVRNGTIHVVVGSDTDLFEDRFWMQTQSLFGERIAVPIAGNGSFIVNMVEHLSGDVALLGLRGRGILQRPFEVVNRIRRAAETRYLATEQALQDRLQQTEARIAALEGPAGEGEAIFSAEQEAELEQFRADLLATRRELRRVQQGLRENIDRLGNQLAAINILLMPLLVILFGITRIYWRRQRLKAGRSAHQKQE